MVGGLSLALGIPAAYGLNKIGVRTANKFIIFFFLINMMPGIVVAIPISVEFLKLGLSNIYGVALAQELVVLQLQFVFHDDRPPVNDWLLRYFCSTTATIITGMVTVRANAEASKETALVT